MNLDKRAVDMLLALDDRSLAAVIGKLARDAGLDPSLIRPDSTQLAGIRAALSMANEDDLKRATELLGRYKNGKNNG